MRRDIVIGFAVVVVTALWATGNGEDAEKRAGLIPFKLDEFLDISSGSDSARIENLKVEEGRETPFGKMEASAKVNITNLTDKQLHVSVYLALFDEGKNLVATGNYSSFHPIGGFGPRETSTQSIKLGYATDLSRAKFYQYRVVTFLEEPSGRTRGKSGRRPTKADE